MNIYVGNLSYELTEDDLQEAFASFGNVASVNIVKDRRSGRRSSY
jgi:RNA recognition motif-containing protein